MDKKTIDLKDVLKMIKKRKKLIGSIFCGFVLIAVVISLITPPTYEAETTLRIKQSKGLASSIMTDAPMASSNTKQLMLTYAEILKSRTVVQVVIDKTQADKEVVPTYEQVLARITTQPVKDTELLKAKVTADTPEEAQLLTNTLVDTFNERMTYLVRSEQTTIREFIGERLQESKKELEQAETLLGDYKREQKMVAADSATKALVDQFATIDKLTAENTVATATAQARLDTATQQLSQEKPGFVADSPLIQQHKGRLAELEVKLVSLSANYTDKHPEVIATRAAIAETEGELSQEIALVVSANSPSMNPIHQGLIQSQIQAEAEIAAHVAQKQAIEKNLSSSQQELSKLPTKEQGLAKVMREAAVNQEIYIMLSKRHEEARISEVMQPTDVQVIDVAIEPTGPITPRKALNVLIGAVLGLLIGLATAITLEYMNKTIQTAEDVQYYLELPVLGSIPDFDHSVAVKQHGLWAKLKSFLTAKKGGHV